jgi:Predicted signal transduction protein with a C-terminal ATPase domain
MILFKSIYDFIIKGKLKNKLLAYSMTILFFSLVTTGFVSYLVSSSAVRDWVLKSNNEILNQCNENIDYNLKGIENAVNAIFDKVDIGRYLVKTADYNLKKELESKNSMLQEINKAVGSREEIENIYIIGDNGITYSNDDYQDRQDFNRAELEQLLQNKSNRDTWAFTEKMEDVGSSKRITLCKAILDKDNARIGVILVFLRIECYQDIWDRINLQKKFVYMVNDSDVIIKCPDNNEIGSKLDKVYKSHLSRGINKIGDKKFLVSNITSDYTKWKLFIIEPYDNINLSFNKLLQWLALSFAISFILFIILANISGSAITIPIKRLLCSISNINKGQSISSDMILKPGKRSLASRLLLRLNFRKKMTIVLIGLIILPIILLMFVSYNVTNGIVQTKVKDTILIKNLQAKKRLEYYINSFENSIFYLYDNNFINILKKDQYVYYQDYDKDNAEVKELVASIQKQNRDISYVNVYKSNTKLLFSSGFGEQLIPGSSFDILNKYEECRNIWFETYKDYNNDYMITIGKKINNVYDFSKVDTIGYVFINVNENGFENIYKDNIESNDNSYIIEKNGTVVSHTDKNMIGKKLEYPYTGKYLDDNGITTLRQSGGDEYMVSYFPINNTDWIFVNMISLKAINESMKKIIYLYLVIVMLSILGIALVVYKISKKISGPINILTNRVDRFARYELDSTSQIRTGDEIEQLSVNFEKMIDRIETLINEVYEEKLKNREIELRKKEAELTTLQAQINPHFLYNTLEVIRWQALVLTKGENDITRLVTSLASFFRLGLNKGVNIVSLKDEIEHVNNYMTIMNFRYKNSITVNWNIDPALLPCKVIKVILQPIIENAIYHGIKPKKGEGVITVIGCRHTDSCMEMCIEDDGVGMDNEKAELLNSIFQSSADNESIGYGLKNVNQRIKLCYGEEFGMSISSQIGIGTSVVLKLPCVYS